MTGGAIPRQQPGLLAAAAAEGHDQGPTMIEQSLMYVRHCRLTNHIEIEPSRNPELSSHTLTSTQRPAARSSRNVPPSLRKATEDVHVPSIWRAEFAAALLALSHNRRLPPARVPAILDDIEQLDFVHDAGPPSTRSLIDIARRYALNAYDACYLELALRLRLPLAARDRPLRRAAERAGLLLA